MNQKIPSFLLSPNGPCSQFALDKGLHTFSELAIWVRNLPYGRNADRSRWMLVFEEERGTCSSKHALLKAVAREQAREEVELVLGMYRMDPQNTPGVGEVLSGAGMEWLPEAHCYLRVGEARFDLTSPQADFSRIKDDLLQEQSIQPEQVGSWKVEFHRQFMADWGRENRPERTFADLWKLREACIDALSHGN